MEKANNDNWIFLTENEAKAAIAIDFRQYECQLPLLHQLKPLILDENDQEQKFTDEDLGDALASALESGEYSLPFLADIAQRIFQTRTRPAVLCSTHGPGIWIENNMAQFVCQQCGECCKILDYENECTQEDYDRWKARGRNDILSRVLVIHRLDGATEYKIWVEPVTQNPYDRCPWLKSLPAENKYICLIHDIKPEVCRDYPFTRKHAIMTGCNGEFKHSS